MHDEVAVGLEARRHRPVHLLVGGDVDVGIDDEHVLDVDEARHAGRDGVARLAGHALAQRDADIEIAAARRRRIDRDRLAHRELERLPDHDLGAHRGEHRGVGAAHGAAADGRGLEQRVAAPRDRGEVEHRVLLHRAVVAEELAVGAFGLDVAARVEIALEHHLGVGRHADVVGHALDHGERRVAQRRDDAELVDRHAHHRGDVVDRMGADDEAHRQRLALATALAS